MKKILSSVSCAITLILSAQAHAGYLENTCLVTGDVDDCIDLTTTGSSVVEEGAIFYSPSEGLPGGTGNIETFLRTQATGPSDENPDIGGRNDVQSGYNTDGDLMFDTKGGAFTHSLLTSDVLAENTVIIGGIEYAEFILDINNFSPSPYLEINELEIYMTDDPTTAGPYPGNLGEKVWDLDATDDSTIVLNYLNYAGSGDPDMIFLLPAALLRQNGGQHIVFYNEFNLFNDGFDEWARTSPTFTGEFCEEFPEKPLCQGVLPGNPEVPTPATLSLLGLGLAGLIGQRRRRKIR